MDVVIDFGTGWACSNEADDMEEKELITLDSGERVSKRTHVIRAQNFLNVVGEIKIGDEANLVYRGEDGIAKGYGAIVTILKNELLVLKVTSIIENYKLITQKIKLDFGDLPKKISILLNLSSSIILLLYATPTPTAVIDKTPNTIK
jgi:hypothetical protein